MNKRSLAGQWKCCADILKKCNRIFALEYESTLLWLIVWCNVLRNAGPSYLFSY